MDNEKEICADNLSDCECSDNIEDFSKSNFDSSDSDSSDIVVTRRPRLYPLQYRDFENDSDSEDDLWSDTDIEPVLEAFEGVPGVKIMPNASESVEDVISLFIRIDLFGIMTIESNLYHSQISYLRKPKTKKSIKWTDITVPEMKKFIDLTLL
ncbi:hypothetical protein M0802_014678 [Mischocyttarus mexicanus]|nr:hypothetical protein M0802_014678 [Mischocyttarus mexicanus]